MIELILAAGIAAFLLFYFGSSINEKEHFGLRLLLFSFGIIIMILIGKGTIDSTTTCENVLNLSEQSLHYEIVNETAHLLNGSTIVAQNDTDHVVTHINTTNYYSTRCYDKTTSTSDTALYKILVWIFVLYSTYIVFYFVYWLFGLTMKFIRRRR